MHPLSIATLACALGAGNALAQATAPSDAAAPASPAGVARASGPAVSAPLVAASGKAAGAVVVTRVAETRSNNTGRGSLTLTLSIVGGVLPSTAAVRHVTVTRAEDNQGRAIGPSPTGPAPGFDFQSVLDSGVRGVLQGFARLGGPVRDVESLRFVEGGIEIFIPSESNGAMVRIPNIVSHSGRIEDPALVKHGIDFRFYGDAASFVQGKRDLDPPSATSGAPGSVMIVANAAVSGPTFPQGAALYVHDPSGRYVAYQLQHADGSPVPRIGSRLNDVSSGGWGHVNLVAPLPANAQLVIYLLVPEAMQTLPFRLEGVQLP